MRPIGYFVHHQGRGHAERCAAIANALTRPVTIFCARDDIFPPLRPGVAIRRIPSLFQPTGQETGRMGHIATPDTLHCAPLGWPGIRRAMAELAGWFDWADPVLMISDVSAEIAQFARLCSVPCVKVVQHGDRGDPGHLAAYQGAAGLLAPCAPALAQPDWPQWMRDKMFFAGGLGVGTDLPGRDSARERLGLEPQARIVLVVSGGGGNGFAQAPLGVGARALPDAQWITIGEVQRDWHATEPDNISHQGWVDNAPDWIAAADLVISSTGNTTCHQILAAGKPWLAVPEWRYFDEQVAKAASLAQAGVAVARPHLPASAQAWRSALADAVAGHDPDRQRALVLPDAAGATARWLEALIADLWPNPDSQAEPFMQTHPHRSVSALTIARGRDEHLANVIRGLTAQTQPPVELLIGVMQPLPYDDLPEAPFPIRQIPVPGDALPLARARNVVASAAQGEVLVFIDVDCIPGPGVIADYARHCAPDAGLMMGEVMYLPGGATRDGLDFDRFDQVAVLHSDRRGPPAEGLEPCGDYRCFWSLNFAMHRRDFRRSGGFDERFEGYGGEDTDFGRNLDFRGIALNWIRGARVYHQHHPHHMPPVHHIASVVRNAELFALKWGYRTMEHWLYCFAQMGLIENTPGGLRILRAPGSEDFELCRQQADMPYANTRRVIDLLHARLGDKVANDPAVRRRDVERAQKAMLSPAAE